MSPSTSQPDTPRRPRPAAGEAGAASSDVDLGEVERTLAEAREQAVRNLAELTGSYDDLVAASALSNADDEHDPEGATFASERSQLDALVRAARERLSEINAAAARLAEGRYGICESCGGQIPGARLEARPVARTCIDCAGR